MAAENVLASLPTREQMISRLDLLEKNEGGQQTITNTIREGIKTGTELVTGKISTNPADIAKMSREQLLKFKADIDERGLTLPDELRNAIVRRIDEIKGVADGDGS